MRKRDLTLWALARCPFLPADDLALLAGTGVRAAHAHLTRLVRAGLVDSLHPCGTRLHLYFLSPAGVTAAARAAGTSPAALNARYGLGERALRHRLPSLERLVASRRVLLALHHELTARGGTLEGWRAWPVPWPYTRGSRRHLLSLDGEGTLVLPTASGRRYAFGLLWDGDPHVPKEVLAERLALLEMLCASPAYTGPCAPCVPPVLLVAATAERVPRGHRPGLLWTTQAEIAKRGPLEASWRGSDLAERALPLAAALATRVAGPADALPRLLLARGEELATSRSRGRHRRLQERIDALRIGTGSDTALLLLALAVPPRGLEVLAVVGQHPLLQAAEIATACALNLVDVWKLLGLLCRHDLALQWAPPGKSRKRRYVLSARGLRLLAARAGLSPAAYRRIYGALDDASGRARKGLRFAQRNLAHTDGINRTYLALLAAARAADGALGWRGEWACAQRYSDGTCLRTLRPDAEARYMGPCGGQRIFVEVDRGTKRSPALAVKLARYASFRASVGRDQVRVLLVTTGYERGWEMLRLNETLPDQTGMPSLDLLVTTHAEIAERGPQARIWRGTSDPCMCLDSVVRGDPRRDHCVHQIGSMSPDTDLPEVMAAADTQRDSSTSPSHERVSTVPLG